LERWLLLRDRVEGLIAGNDEPRELAVVRRRAGDGGEVVNEIRKLDATGGQRRGELVELTRGRAERQQCAAKIRATPLGPLLGRGDQRNEELPGVTVKR